jgi:sodium/bile acid cotransporter 7
MMVRRSSFVNDEHGCRSKYERGGYSDDLILAALCDEFRRTVGAPADCIFPQRVKHTWRQWWNYMRRQLFVMDTYSTTHNKRVNHGMLLVLSYLSLAVTSGVALCVHDLGVWAYEVATESGGGTPGWEVTEWTLPRTLSVCAFFTFAGAMGGARSMYVEIGRMATLLGDEGVTESVAAIDWWRVAAAFWCCYACVPAMAIYTLANPRVVWSGIPYRKRRGLCMRMPTDDQIRRMKIERMNAGFGFKVPEVDAGTLLQKYQNPRNLVIVDVRTEAERAVSVIKGAVTKEQYEADVNGEYVGKKIVAYCTIGYRSGKYVETLIKDKGVDAYNLRGSILAWTHAGGPLETADGTPTNVVHTWGKAWALPRRDHVAVYFDRPAVAFVKKVLGLAR